MNTELVGKPKYKTIRTTSNNQRTRFYGFTYGCTITLSSNKEPSTVKVFKTLGLESNNTDWYAYLTTELESGRIGDQTNLKLNPKT